MAEVVGENQDTTGGEAKSVSVGEIAGLFQVMAAVSKQVERNSTIRVPHMLYDQLKWVKMSPPSHPTMTTTRSAV